MGKHHTERPVIEPNRVYSRAEVAEILDISLSTVKRMLAAGQLRASQPPGIRRVFITGQAILDMLEAGEHAYASDDDSSSSEQPDREPRDNLDTK